MSNSASSASTKILAATAAAMMVASSVVLVVYRFKRRGSNSKDDDILKAILEKSVPVAASQVLAHDGTATCERRLDGRQLIITADARVADYVFNGPAKSNYVRRPAANEGLEMLGMLHCGLIWNNDLSVWRNVRGCFQKALGETALRLAVTVAREECLELLEEEGANRDKSSSATGGSAKAMDLLAMSRRVTFRATLTTFFGVHSSDFGTLGIDEDDFIDSIVRYFKAWEFFLFRSSWDEGSSMDEHVNAVQDLRRHVSILLTASAAKQAMTTTTTSPDEISESRRRRRRRRNHTLFVDHLRAVCHEDQEAPPQLLQQSALEMLLAGTDTSSVTAYYALLGLASNADLQQELRAELTSRRSPGLVLDSVIQETLRFKPVGPVVLREAVAMDPNFPGISTPIRKGAAVLVHLAEMNLREEYWDTDANVFRPKRFLLDTAAAAAASSCSSRKKIFFPFGEGPKGCIGMHLGRREVTAIVETVVLHYDLSLMEGAETLSSLATHWDIANQPDEPSRILVTPAASK